MSAQQLLSALLDFPADKLDKKTIEYIASKLVTAEPAKKAKKVKKTTTDNKDAADKPKRTLNGALAARNACWAAKKAEGMAYKQFTELWKTFSQSQKDEWKVSKPAEASAESIIDDIDAALETAVIDEE